MGKHFSIKIPKPCNENWNTMTPNKKGRFCDSCTKTVVDFTKMNTFEIQDFIEANTSVSICGHIKQTQLDSINLKISVQIINKELQFHKLFFYALLIAMGTSLFNCTSKTGEIQKIDSIEVVNTIVKCADTLNTAKQKVSKNIPVIPPPIPDLVEGEMIMVMGDIEAPPIEPKEPYNFYIVEAVPEFPNTPQHLNSSEKEAFFKKSLTSFIIENFKTDILSSIVLKGKVKIYTKFEISNTGQIEHLKIRAPHPKLEAYTKALFLKLPILKPAKLDGKNVATTFIQPIMVKS